MHPTGARKGGARRYRVWWRLGGTRYGEPQSETFFDKGSASTFKLAVEAAGHDWPDGYLRGIGWVVDEPTQPEPIDEPVPFGDYALAYVRGLSGVDARTRHDYERDLTRHLLPVFGDLNLVAVDAQAVAGTEGRPDRGHGRRTSNRHLVGRCIWQQR